MTPTLICNTCQEAEATPRVWGQEFIEQSLLALYFTYISFNEQFVQHRGIDPQGPPVLTFHVLYLWCQIIVTEVNDRSTRI